MKRGAQLIVITYRQTMNACYVCTGWPKNRFTVIKLSCICLKLLAGYISHKIFLISNLDLHFLLAACNLFHFCKAHFSFYENQPGVNVCAALSSEDVVVPVFLLEL